LSAKVITATLVVSTDTGIPLTNLDTKRIYKKNVLSNGSLLWEGISSRELHGRERITTSGQMFGRSLHGG